MEDRPKHELRSHEVRLSDKGEASVWGMCPG